MSVRNELCNALGVGYDVSDDYLMAKAVAAAHQRNDWQKTAAELGQEKMALQTKLERTQQLLMIAYTTIGKMHCGIED